MKTIEKYTQLIKTPYVFHLEDDYEFFDSGFIELSFRILDSDTKISQVLLEDEQHSYSKVDINNPLCYKVMTNKPNEINANNGDGPLTVFSWRPSLKRIEIQKLRMPYQPWDDEYTIQLKVNKIGMYSVITKNIKDGKKGFCTHIGKNYHVPENFTPFLFENAHFGKFSSTKSNGAIRMLNAQRCKKITIIGRKDFSNKINIRLKDI